jgi:hypothetical protein
MAVWLMREAILGAMRRAEAIVTRESVGGEDFEEMTREKTGRLWTD